MQQHTIRVYGVYFDEKDRLLLMNEEYSGKSFTKFPGGGLEFGEGIKDCLKREFLEELGWEISVKELIYLTDFFQQSAFDKNIQVISVYYRIEKINEKDVVQALHVKEYPCWIYRQKLSVENVTFPIDQKVVSLLLDSTN